jgi:hypothetical protein
MFVKVENFDLESKFKKGFEKCDMHVVITIELMTILLLIIAFEYELIPMFPHGFHKRIQKSSSKLKLYYHFCCHCWCKGKRG